MKDREVILSKIREYTPEMVAVRRSFHRYPELGWCEFRTASIIAYQLRKLGYRILTGPEVTPEALRMGVPSKEELKEAYSEAIRNGAITEELLPMNGGFTGVVGILENGSGPVFGMRFDMDALPIQEADWGQEYRSVRPGFLPPVRFLYLACALVWMGRRPRTSGE